MDTAGIASSKGQQEFLHLNGSRGSFVRSSRVPSLWGSRGPLQGSSRDFFNMGFLRQGAAGVPKPGVSRVIFTLGAAGVPSPGAAGFHSAVHEGSFTTEQQGYFTWEQRGSFTRGHQRFLGGAGSPLPGDSKVPSPGDSRSSFTRGQQGFLHFGDSKGSFT